MKKFVTWFFILLKRQLKNPFFISLLIIFPVMLTAISRITEKDTSSRYIAGIYIENNSDEVFANLIADALTETDGTIKFVRYDDAASMKDDIISEKLICGYIIPDNLPKRLKQLDISNCITVLTLPASALQSSVNEMVYAELIKFHGYNILENYINVSQNLPEGDYKDELFGYYDKYVYSEKLLNITYDLCDADGNINEGTISTSFTFPVRGFLSIMIFLSGMSGCILWQRDNEKGTFLTLNGNFRTMTKLSYIIVPTVIFSAASILTLYVTGNGLSPAKEFTSIMLYILMIAIFGFILIKITVKSRFTEIFIPILIVCCIVFCPVFIDMGLYFAPAKYIRLFLLPYHYINMFG